MPAISPRVSEDPDFGFGSSTGVGVLLAPSSVVPVVCEDVGTVVGVVLSPDSVGTVVLEDVSDGVPVFVDLEAVVGIWVGAVVVTSKTSVLEHKAGWQLTSCSVHTSQARSDYLRISRQPTVTRENIHDRT